MKKWFVTGVSSGLGRALAVGALGAGDVVAGSVREAAARDEFIALNPEHAHAFIMDVTDRDAVTEVMQAADEAVGGIDVLVNNAGVSLEGTIEETGWTEILEQFQVNVFGPVAVMKALLPAMRKRRRGLIVNITSLAGYATGGGTGFYGGAKLALEGISKSLAKECAPFGIEVMIVIPGAFRTALGANRRSAPDGIADYTAQNEARRVRLAALSGQQRGDPSRAAQAILAAVNATPPPRRLVVGVDAADYIAADLAAFGEELARWNTVSRATDFLEKT
jgi:NAD(P)-dependent dehydrogenase (short-subunit alcohol dehydrogenase family)